MRRVVLVVAALLLAGGVAAWVAARPAKAPAPVAPRAPEAPAITLPSAPAVPSRLLGINEGLGSPERNAFAAAGTDAAIARRAVMLRDLGAGVVRANNHGWPGLNHLEWTGPAGMDRLMDIAGRGGIDVIAVVGPWPGARTAVHTPRYVPDDLPAYEAWVTSVVERYDGDGVDDAPGLLRPVLAWEVDNEPDHHNNVAPRGADVPDFDPTTFETPEEYATVLVATSRAIRAADPDATVLLGGMFRPAGPQGRAYLEAVLARPGAHAAIDGLSLHCYFSQDSLDTVKRTMSTARELAPGLPVWITETGVPSVPPPDHADEDWHARMVAAVVGGFLAEGAEGVLWHTLVDARRDEDAGDPNGFAGRSLFRVTGGNPARIEPKPGAVVFSRLAARLAGLGPRDLAEVPAEDGRLLETPNGWLAFWGAPPVPPGGGAVTDLLTGETREADHAVSPAWIARP
ncbi:MAG: glycosyl hydrolase [Myxococcota bacterium]